VHNPSFRAWIRHRRARLTGFTAACFVCACAVVVAGKPAASLSDAEVEAALRIASDEQAATAFLDTHRLQARIGVGNGPMLGWLSTPFSRIVLAGLAARKTGHSISRDDIGVDPFLSELVVIATPQPAANTDALAQVIEIAVESRVGPAATEVLLPMRMRSATVAERKLLGMESAPEAVVAVFSLEALAPILEGRDPHVVVRVTFDKAAKGSTPSNACKDCVVSISDR
jgi:hypothetical protein